MFQVVPKKPSKWPLYTSAPRGGALRQHIILTLKLHLRISRHVHKTMKNTEYIRFDKIYTSSFAVGNVLYAGSGRN